VDKRIKKNNSAAYKILFNSIDVTVTVRCKWILRKCLSTVLHGTGSVYLENDDIYSVHLSFKRIFRHIFGLSMRVHVYLWIVKCL
jgi:hypothetical protein